MWKKEFEIKRGVLVRYNGEAKEIVLPKKVKAIGEKVFFENNDLCSITFPEGLKTIGKDAFHGCCSLTRIENIALRFITCSGILALGGICVTLQTASVTQGLSIKYYYRGKLLQCIFSLVISISIVAERYLIPLLMILYFGIFYGKTKISGSNMKKAVV